VTAANEAVTRPEAGWQTVAIRSHRQVRVSPPSATQIRCRASMLRAQGFSLQANAQGHRGPPARRPGHTQFGYLNAQLIDHLAAGAPVLSVDTKKKELVGEFHNGGREYQPQGSPVRVDVHDFPDPELGEAIPYGIYDVAANTGWVSIGADHDTSATPTPTGC
jgi:hypothetical protein